MKIHVKYRYQIALFGIDPIAKDSGITRLILITKLSPDTI